MQILWWRAWDEGVLVRPATAEGTCVQRLRMLTCSHCLKQEPEVSFRYYKAMSAKKMKTLCDQHLKRAPNGWLQCPGCALKGRVPFHPEREYSEGPQTYKTCSTARRRCNTCRLEKRAEELEQGRQRLKDISRL